MARYVRFVLVSLGRPANLADLNPASLVELILAGLPVTAAEELLGSSVVNQLPSAKLARLWRSVGGNPYLARLMAQAWLANPSISGTPLPAGATERLDWALRPLSHKARALANKLSIIGTSLSYPLIRLLARPHDIHTDQLIRELVEYHVLIEKDAQSWGLPELLRARLAEETPAPIQRTAHASVGTYFRGQAARALSPSEQAAFLRLSLDHMWAAGKWQPVLALATELQPLLPAGDAYGAWRVARIAAQAAERIGRRADILQWWTEALRNAIDVEQLGAAQEAQLALQKPLRKVTASLQPQRQLAFVQLGRWHYRRLEFPAAERNFQGALDLAELLADEVGIVDCQIRLGQTLRRQGNYTQARVRLEAALALSQRLNRTDLAFESLSYLGTIARRLGHVVEAYQHYREAARIANLAQNPRQIEEAQSYLGRLAAHSAVRNFEQAEKYFRRALDLAQKLRNQRGVRIETTRLIDVLIKAEKFEEAAGLLREAHAANEAAQDRIGLAWDELYHGLLLKHAGRAAAGNARIRRGMDQFRTLGVADDEWRADFEAALLK
jgi:tetratricopeptide (TPR) repeat protein